MSKPYTNYQYIKKNLANSTTYPQGVTEIQGDLRVFGSIRGDLHPILDDNGADTISNTIDVDTITNAGGSNISLSNKNLINVGTIATTGYQISSASGNIGTATLVAGTATVVNANITANDKIMLTRSGNVTGVTGFLKAIKNVGVNFVITSTDAAGTTVNEASTIDYVIIRSF